MSRSYKHTPITKSCGYGSWGKRQANKKVRKSKILTHKSSRFKRLYESWDICDYISYYPRKAAFGDPTKLKNWEKYYHRK